MTLSSILRGFNRIVTKLEKLHAREQAKRTAYEQEEQAAVDLIAALKARRLESLRVSEQALAVKDKIAALVA